MAIVTLRVTEIVRSNICVASSDGHKVHDAIFRSLKAGNTVELSFSNVRRMTTAFLNTAVGQLFNEFHEDEIKARLRFVEIDTPSAELLKRVIARAKTYFSNVNHVSQAINRLIKE